ncbi:MAG TPA: S53 family peptidase [Solirubrobacterales bacterium]|nr:S53 family peptidase [Solirubrobacterales bacterium]
MAAAAPPTAAAASRAKGDPGLAPAKVEALVELRHPRGLNRFARAVSDPSSPRYRRYASVEQLVARFGAKKQVRKRVLGWLARHGLEGAVSPTGTYVTARLPRARAERLLPASGASASASGSGRRVPVALRGAVRRVSLVSTRPAVERHRAQAPSAGASATPKKPPYSSILPHSGTAAGCEAASTGGAGPGFEPFTPNQYLTAYGHAAMHARGLKGQGQTAAVVETGGFRHADVVAFAKCFGLKPPPIQKVPVGVKKPLPPEDETTLDLEMLTVGAPGLDRIHVYEGPGSLQGVALTAATALGGRGHQPDVISISLGFCEPQMGGNLVLRNAFDNIFAVAAGAGISVLVSAGDQGSSGCRVEEEDEEATALPVTAVSLPASSPYATAVGGTNLALTKKNRIKQEIVWNNSSFEGKIGIPWGGGGGGSIISPRTPWWQSAVKRYGPGRKVPDIAALADSYPGYAFFCTAASCLGGGEKARGWSRVGGTSAAAPLMAAGVALVNQHAARRGQPPLGFLNPLLYDLGAEAKSRGAVFNDVTVGNNDIGLALPPEAGGGKPVGCCQARPGYDWASGWGSPRLANLARAAARAGS